MKIKVITILLILTTCFLLSGCEKNNSKDIVDSNKDFKQNKIKTKLFCSNEGTLFHYKKRVENEIYIDKNNKLVDYNYIEIYYSFDSDEQFKMVCDGSEEEAENNNKMYNYMTQKADCNRDTKVVTISNKYKISKLPSKNVLTAKDVKENLDENYIFSLENYKNIMTNKGYTCE